MQRLCPLCKGSGRFPPGVCRHCHGAGHDPTDTGDTGTLDTAFVRIPVLAPLALVLFLALVALQFAGQAHLGAGERLLASVVLAMLFGWPALFAIARSLRAGPFGHSLRAAAIVLAPVGVTLVFAAWVLMAPGARWPGLAAGMWLFAQLVVVPACWAAARRDFER
ncbi:hypothetical protein [Luteimonas sp. MC1572]|uniref:hypothetical protein n=1 Tax=Luteimonas sp. MC1572 TaxID=2799325 RepID=UPI0018F08981|nr:hypothetical protein [Luteimonas sp. MC1572]MBJ6980890.1 hypothetical protein [Luteimonas sp. MC1572]QQO02249.1 hypothetical protein JGR64_08455 [Luteimonas sp. MC1572]